MQFNNNNGEITLNGYNAESTKNFVSETIEILSKNKTEIGLEIGIHCEQALYETLRDIDVNVDELTIWTINPQQSEKNIEVSSKENLPTLELTTVPEMIQVSDKGIVTGIYDTTGEYVDINYCYYNYEDTQYQWERMTFPNRFKTLINNPGTLISHSITLGAGMLIATVIIKSKKTLPKVKPKIKSLISNEEKKS